MVQGQQDGPLIKNPVEDKSCLVSHRGHFGSIQDLLYAWVSVVDL